MSKPLPSLLTPPQHTLWMYDILLLWSKCSNIDEPLCLLPLPSLSL
jgi:hypothetical protein